MQHFSHPRCFARAVPLSDMVRQKYRISRGRQTRQHNECHSQHKPQQQASNIDDTDQRSWWSDAFVSPMRGDHPSSFARSRLLPTRRQDTLKEHRETVNTRVRPVVSQLLPFLYETLNLRVRATCDCPFDGGWEALVDVFCCVLACITGWA